MGKWVCKKCAKTGRDDADPQFSKESRVSGYKSGKALSLRVEGREKGRERSDKCL